MPIVRIVLLVAVGVVWGSTATAQNSLIPPLNSRPGAAFTLYLDFGGFDFSGNWGANPSDPYFPGSTPAYNAEGSSSTFTATEIANMRQVWARTAEMYSPFNINITTVDPAVAAGQAGSDLQRQNYYDSQARMMHTVIGGNGSWAGGGGFSFVDVADRAYPTSNGYHTNFVFSSNLGNGTMTKWIAEATGHENGHALKLAHQSRYNASGNKTDEYDPGTTARAPVMGIPYSSTRGLWRVGTSAISSTSIQNDIQRLMTNNGIGEYIDSGIGHTREAATVLPMNGTTIDFDLAKGLITPTSITNPNPLGEDNYTRDYFSFVIGPGGRRVAVTLHSGRSTLVPGEADPGATLDATFRLLNTSGGLVQESASGTFTETIALDLTEGTYFFEIVSAGGFADGTAQYYDVGSYFLTGTIVPVPEPALVLLAAAVALGLRAAARRRRAARA